MKMPKGSSEWVGFIARGCSLLAGIALLVATIVALFSDRDEVSTAALIVGALLLVLPMVVDRLEGFSFSAEGLDFLFTQQIADLGAPKAAAILEDTGIARDLETYAFVYNELTDPALLGTRKTLLDKVVARASSVATSRKFDAGEVQALFAAGSPVMRVLVLGLMEGDCSLVSDAVLRSAIGESRSGNEQYHGLLLAERAWPRLSSATRTELSGLIAADQHIALDPDRDHIAKRIQGMQRGY